MKNKLTDLNDHLFAQLERLSDESMDDEQLKKEIQRGVAITSVASQVVANGDLQLKALKIQAEYSTGRVSLPDTLLGKPSEG